MPVIKRYSNRKLYDTESKRYVTLEDLGDFIRQGEDVRVVDHVTGEDLTSVTLLQVIFEEEKKIGGLLPQLFLTRLIRAGGSTVSSLRSRFASLDPFQVVDEEIRRRIQVLVEQGKIEEEEGRQIYELLVKKPAQPAPVNIPVKSADGEEVPTVDTAEAPVDIEELEALQRQVEALEQQLELLRRAA
jgi:polyhydroxyalkanoate synthesis repressor PhaR